MHAFLPLAFQMSCGRLYGVAVLYIAAAQPPHPSNQRKQRVLSRMLMLAHAFTTQKWLLLERKSCKGGRNRAAIREGLSLNESKPCVNHCWWAFIL